MMCITGGLFNMTALVLTPGASDGDPSTGSENGKYDYVQDPISGSFEKVWIPALPEENGNTDPTKGPMAGRRVACSARAILEGGIRVTATTERYSTRGTLETADYIDFEFPTSEVITRRDRITDIRDSKGNLIWIEEESTDRPTVFEVTGVTPVTDPFGVHINNFSLLQRAQNQASLWEALKANG